MEIDFFVFDMVSLAREECEEFTWLGRVEETIVANFVYLESGLEYYHVFTFFEFLDLCSSFSLR
jgi:hypothetical protein